eukprot:781061-Pelagomonas_calceolata.AAC.1
MSGSFTKQATCFWYKDCIPLEITQYGAMDDQLEGWKIGAMDDQGWRVGKGYKGVGLQPETG